MEGKRLTLKQINAAIAPLGYELVKGGKDYFYFSPLRDDVVQLYSSSTSAVTLNQWSLEMWISDLKEKIEESKERRGEVKEIDPQTRYPFGYDGYKNKLEYPTQSKRYLIYDAGTTVLDTTDLSEYQAALPKYPKGVKQMLDINEEEYKAARAAYNEETARLEEMFKQDLFKANGVENHPLRDVVYSRAWSEGHSSGLPEVACVFNDLLEILQSASTIIDPLATVLREIQNTLWGTITPELDDKISKALTDAGYPEIKHRHY